MEHWETLRPGGYRFLWEDSLFRPGTDTFLLSSLPRLKPGLRVVDLCCGAGLLGLLLLQRQQDLFVTGLELQAEPIRLGERTAAENGLLDRLSFRQGDIRQVRTLFPAGSFDLAVGNPPYYPAGSGNLSATLPLSRAEIACTLADVCAAAGWLLRYGGSFCLVHKPERLAELFNALRNAGLEPKRLQTVHTRPEKAPSLILAESRKGGRPGLIWERPLVLKTASGAPTEELNEIYFRKEHTP